MSDIRRLERGDVHEAASVLGRAFGDNPGYLAILPFLSDDEVVADERCVNLGGLRMWFMRRAPRTVWASDAGCDHQRSLFGRVTGVDGIEDVAHQVE